MAGIDMPTNNIVTMNGAVTPGATERKKFGRALRKDFLFDKNYLNLNHGSFGTYPRQLQTSLRKWQDAAEANPDRFIRWTSVKHLNESRTAAAKLLNAPLNSCVFVSNATTGVNTVLRNLEFQNGDKIVYFDTIYGACERTINYITETTPAESVKISYEQPAEDDWLVGEFKRVVQEQQAQGFTVKVALYDTIVSMPGIRLPFEALTEACKELGVLSLIDGAHGIGNIELDLEALDPDFFVSNCHKWLLTPRGCAIFYVPIRNQHLIRSTLPTSHGFVPRPLPDATLPNNPLPNSGSSPFIFMYEFGGTIDCSPYFCIPDALAYRESIGGEKAIMDYTHSLAREAAQLTAKVLDTEVLENSTKTLGRCTMSNIRLPIDPAEVRRLAGKEENVGAMLTAWLTATTTAEYNTFVAIVYYKDAWWARLSAQVYLELADFEIGAKILKELCERVHKGDFLKGLPQI